jgi:hypothetical protein
MHSRCADIFNCYSSIRRCADEGGGVEIWYGIYNVSRITHIWWRVARWSSRSLPSFPIHHTFHAESKLDAVYIGYRLLPVELLSEAASSFVPLVSRLTPVREKRGYQLQPTGAHTHTLGYYSPG